MPNSAPSTHAPDFTAIGDGEPTDAAIAALAALLLDLIERDEQNGKDEK